MNEMQPSSPQWGDIGVSNEVFENIAAICAQKAYGITGIESTEGFVDSLSKVWGRSEAAKGVKVASQEGEVSIELTINVEEGVPIPKAAETLQREVKNVVEEMTGQSIRHVNVLVADVKPAPASAEVIAPYGGAG